jgi:outer membrane protein OmpA-like peptidoglycan-associated protein
MAMDLMAMMRDALTPQLLGGLSQYLGIGQADAEKAVGAAVPAILAGLANQALKPGGADTLINALKPTGDIGRQVDIGKPFNIDDILGDLGRAAGGAAPPAGSPLGGMLKIGPLLLALLFGNKLGGVTDVLGKATGMAGGLLGKLLPLLAPMILGSIVKNMGGLGGLTANGLTDLFNANKDAIIKAAPAGLGQALGIANLNDLGKAASEQISRAAESATRAAEQTTAQAASGLPSWLLPLLALAALGVLAFVFLNRPVEEKVEPVGPGPAPITPKAAEGPEDKPAIDTGAITEAVQNLIAQKLPGDVEVKLPQGSSLLKLIDTFKSFDPAQPSESVVLEELKFEGDSATVNPGSLDMVGQLAAIVKAFNEFKVKFLGRVDGAGEAAALEKISQDQVNAVKDALVKAGIPADRVMVEVKPVDPDKPGRRIEVQVMK